MQLYPESLTAWSRAEGAIVHRPYYRGHLHPAIHVLSSVCEVIHSSTGWKTIEAVHLAGQSSNERGVSADAEIPQHWACFRQNSAELLKCLLSIEIR